jgi:oxalate decarboxylase/phosphoglucose isomerase-like protein (cupin superfamily)
MPPGAGHRFHYHPGREEIIYVLEGVAEQWVGKEKRRLKAGEIAFIARNVVHAIHNSSKQPVSFLAILSPARAKGPFLVDCYEDESWRRVWDGVQKSFRRGSGMVQKRFNVQKRFKVRTKFR